MTGSSEVAELELADMESIVQLLLVSPQDCRRAVAHATNCGNSKLAAAVLSRFPGVDLEVRKFGKYVSAASRALERREG